MESPDETSGITRYSIEESFPYGHICEEKKNYDLAQIVMIYLSEEKKELGNRLLNLLYEIFKSRDNAAGKMKVLHSEYDIQLSHSEEGEVGTMCNLSLGIAKDNAYKGYMRGVDGERKRMTIGLLEKQVAIPIIISVSGLDEDDVRRIAEEEHLPC